MWVITSSGLQCTPKVLVDYQFRVCLCLGGLKFYSEIDNNHPCSIVLSTNMSCL